MCQKRNRAENSEHNIFAHDLISFQKFSNRADSFQRAGFPGEGQSATLWGLSWLVWTLHIIGVLTLVLCAEIRGKRGATGLALCPTKTREAWMGEGQPERRVGHTHQTLCSGDREYRSNNMMTAFDETCCFWTIKLFLTQTSNVL